MLTPEQLSDAIEVVYEAGWTDGLPVVPPTRPLVQRFLAYVERHPDEPVGEIPPLGGRATIEKIAINAVMAGCKPEYFPVVIAAIDALLQPRFNLRAVQCSTHIATPLVIVSGPIVRQLGLNYGNNCFGQGTRANATIGRAVKLVLTNVGGALPGEADKATFGHPGKYTYCVAENDEANPWAPLHVDYGYAPTDSVVTVHPSEAPHNLNNHGADNPRDLLLTFADSMAILCCNNIHVMGDVFLVLGPEHAHIIANAGWSKNDVRLFLWEHARQPVRLLKLGGVHGRNLHRNNLWPRWVDRDDDDFMVPLVRRPEDIHVMVAGGPGSRVTAARINV
ncbi:MAG: hypothetical protein HYU88_01740 [Chloroflexi bacterium]|nr:hypothetical protein [Chloroflexota bacterium]